jgi:hypothetical protein
LARSQLGAQLVNGKSLNSDRSVTSDGKHYGLVGLADGAPTNGVELRLRLEVYQNMEAALKNEATMLFVLQSLTEKLEREASHAMRSLARRVKEVLTEWPPEQGRYSRRRERKRADVARARRRWIRHEGLLDPAHLVFIDETAITTNMVRLNGWNPRG